mmetsp:Transcript_45145/g.79601  ORF Transcript_45145/g.79601 Transcript_45145/m.79601 type:complete len:82 (+) Transcript_45145:89-334(+)
MMNNAKMDIVMATLKANGGKCTFSFLFAEAEKAHCDVLSAALKSMKKDKVISFESMMPLLLMPRDENVEISLLDEQYNARA